MGIGKQHTLTHLFRTNVDISRPIDFY